MTMNLKTFVFAAAASALSVGSLAATAIPAMAHEDCDWDGDDCWESRPHYYDRDAAAYEVCDWDGDDCWESHPHYYDRDWDNWRRHEWRERREWEERRAPEDYRRWYWSHRPYYYGYPGYGGGSVWLNF